MATPEIELHRRFPAESGEFYRVVQKIGSGGNSSVYLVQAITGDFRGILFAMKLFTKISDQTRLGRFRREVKLLRELSHPAIMRVYDIGELMESHPEKEAFPFVICDYFPRTLYDELRAGLRMPERLSFALQLLSAVAFLSGRKPSIVHRDIKPENIFVRGRACILGDLGLIKTLVTNAEEEQASDLASDVEYMIDSVGPRLPRYYRTPDLVDYCRGARKDLSAKSDVFQLGLVFAEMFTGECPLKECRKILDPVELMPLGTILGSQSNAIKPLLERMLSTNDAERPSAHDLFDPWEGILKEASNTAHALEGRVF